MEAERKEREAAREAEEVAKREVAEREAKAAAAAAAAVKAHASQSRSSSGKSTSSAPRSPQSTRPPLPGLPPVPVQASFPTPPIGHIHPGKGGMMSGIGRGKLPASLPPHIPPPPMNFGKGPMPNGPPRPPNQPIQGPPHPSRGMPFPQPNGPLSPQAPFPRPPSGPHIPGMLGAPMGSLGPVNHAIPAKPNMGMNGPMGLPPTAFGAIGLGHAPVRGPVPPFPHATRAASPSSARTSFSGPSGVQTNSLPIGNRPPSASSNGSSAIGPLTSTKVSNPSTAQINSPSFGTTPSLASLNMGSLPVERKSSGEQSAGPIGPPPGHQKRVSQDFKAVQPIGPPRALNGSNLSDPEDASAPSSSTSASLRSPSPPPILGSAALLEDLEEDESSTPDLRRHAPAAPIGAAFYGPSSIWGSASQPNGGWQTDPKTHQVLSPSPPPAPRPGFDRQTIIADRGRIAFKHVAESYGVGRSHFHATELHRMCLSLYPDSSSVDVNEFIAACMSKGEKIWDIRMDGSQYLMRFVGLN